MRSPKYLPTGAILILVPESRLSRVLKLGENELVQGVCKS